MFVVAFAGLLAVQRLISRSDGDRSAPATIQPREVGA